MKLTLTLFERNLLIFLFLISLSIFSSLSFSKHNSVVVTRHHLATEVGSKILSDGGNAFDAAISVAFALAVVNPSAGNIGGGGFALLYDANKKTIESIDYRERAPIRAKEDMFRFLAVSQHRKRLAHLNIVEDVKFCLQENITTVIPVLKGDELILYE